MPNLSMFFSIKMFKIHDFYATSLSKQLFLLKISMGKGKLVKFEAIKSFANIIELDTQYKGLWGKQFFKNDNPMVVELACGKGDYAIGMAKLFPEKNFLGVDIKGNRLYTASNTARAEGVENVAFLRTQIDHLDQYFEKGEISEIWITFPDPFLRKGDAKRRLTSTKFLDVYRKILTTGTKINLKTDSDELYAYTKEIVENQRLEIVDDFPDVYAEGKNYLLYNIQTYYEKMHIKDRRTIHFISFLIN